MAAAAQILANQQNSQKSAGATSAAGKQASSQNRFSHGLCIQSTHTNASFYFLDDENKAAYDVLCDRLCNEHQPETETETILLRRMAQHEWLRARALRFQNTCLFEDQHIIATQQFALYLRCQTTHERAFYKALNELQKLRNERTKEQIGFESQKARPSR